MTDIQNLTAQQLRKAADLQEKIESLTKERDAILVNGGGLAGPTIMRRGRPPLNKVTITERPTRKMSAAAKKRISDAAKARWAAAKKAGKTSL